MAVTKTANVNVRIQENIKQQAEQILETTIPKSLPAQDDMDEKTFNALMAKGYNQAVQGDSYTIDDVFEDLER